MPSSKKKNYFQEEQENAVINYLKSEDKEERDRIFQVYLLPAFTKMIESIIRRYNLFVPEEEFDETFRDTISFLMTKINNFNGEKGYKAYSYCGTVCKNYLIFKIKSFKKQQKTNVKYESSDEDEVPEVDITGIKDDHEEEEDKNEFLNCLINGIKQELDNMLEFPSEYQLNENEKKTGSALKILLDRWEENMNEIGSNKFNNATVLTYLKNMTLLDTVEVRKSMRKFKKAYDRVKENLL